MSEPLGILKLRNAIRNYTWGSRGALSEWMGRPPAGEYEAELWMGAHPRGPSEALLEGMWIDLRELILARPAEMLGPRVAERWGQELPFLFKVLAVERPLSLQAHPSLEQARAGFALENARGVPLHAPSRAYSDPNRKPELVCALSPFLALKGFRPPPEIVRQLDRVEAWELIRDLPPDGASTLRAIVHRLLGLDAARTEEVVARARRAAEPFAAEAPVAWFVRLTGDHPGDPAVFAPLLLNLVELAPGEALYLAEGELHCYLRGMALEVMANSDNVLRGGLTSKHVARDELMQTLRFEGSDAIAIRPEAASEGVERYPAPAEEFALSRVAVDTTGACGLGPIGGGEILLCTQGRVLVSSEGARVELRQGESAFVPFCVGFWEVEGNGILYRASTGL